MPFVTERGFGAFSGDPEEPLFGRVVVLVVNTMPRGQKHARFDEAKVAHAREVAARSMVFLEVRAAARSSRARRAGARSPSFSRNARGRAPSPSP